jgi:hypothetical protein
MCSKSCTIIIGAKVVCVRDGGEWKECEVRIFRRLFHQALTWECLQNGHTVDDFISQIQEEYERLNGQRRR